MDGWSYQTKHRTDPHTKHCADPHQTPRHEALGLPPSHCARPLGLHPKRPWTSPVGDLFCAWWHWSSFCLRRCNELRVLVLWLQQLLRARKNRGEKLELDHLPASQRLYKEWPDWVTRVQECPLLQSVKTSSNLDLLDSAL